jgi:hypothetical protein
VLQHGTQCMGPCCHPSVAQHRRAALAPLHLLLRAASLAHHLVPRGCHAPCGNRLLWSADLLFRGPPSRPKLPAMASQAEASYHSPGIPLQQEGASELLSLIGRVPSSTVKPRALWRLAAGQSAYRYGEPLLSLRHPCRIRGRPTFLLLAEAVACLCKGKQPDLSWITPHEPLPVPATP